MLREVFFEVFYFLHNFHLISFFCLQDYMGRGEFEPNPHFTQNLGEAEYVVALYQYLRLLGHSSDRIAILTTYRY